MWRLTRRARRGHSRRAMERAVTWARARHSAGSSRRNFIRALRVATRAPAQIQPWYLLLNPKGQVPILVFTPDESLEEKDEVVCGSRAVAAWADANTPDGTLALLPPPGTPAAAACAALLQLHDAFDAEDAAVAFGDLITRVHIAPSRIRHAVNHLNKVAKDPVMHPEVRVAAREKQAALEARAKRWLDVDALRRDTKAAATALLDALDAALSGVGSGPFACGAAYTLADVAATVFLAHLLRFRDLADEVHSRPEVFKYYRDVLSTRPSFAAADVWTSPRPGKAVEAAAGAIAAPFRAAGGAIHKHVIKPVTATEWYANTATFVVDSHNHASVTFNEEVLPAVVAALVATRDALHEHVWRPTAAATVAGAKAFHEHVLVPTGHASVQAGHSIAAASTHAGHSIAAASVDAGKYVAHAARCGCCFGAKRSKREASRVFPCAEARICVRARSDATHAVSETTKKTATYVGVTYQHTTTEIDGAARGHACLLRSSAFLCVSKRRRRSPLARVRRGTQPSCRRSSTRRWTRCSCASREHFSMFSQNDAPADVPLFVIHSNAVPNKPARLRYSLHAPSGKRPTPMRTTCARRVSPFAPRGYTFSTMGGRIARSDFSFGSRGSRCTVPVAALTRRPCCTSGVVAFMLATFANSVCCKSRSMAASSSGLTRASPSVSFS